MEVYTLYVGQGDLTVILGEEEAIIVDSNIPSSNDEKAVFVKRALATILSKHEVIGLIITGFDADHADPRGIGWILGKYRPDWVMYPQYFKKTKNAGQVMAAITRNEKKRKDTEHELERLSIRLDRIDDRIMDDLSDEWDLEIFSPHIDDMNSSNNCSLVVKLQPTGFKEWFGHFTYLITGDTENDRWDSINQYFGNQLQSDVMAAPHHGSENGINKKTLRYIQPQVVLNSAGIDNQFGHPHKKSVKIFRSEGAKFYSTHKGINLKTYHSFWSGYVTETWDE